MHSSSLFLGIIVTLFYGLISWLELRLLSRWFSFWRKPFIRNIYRIFTLTSATIIAMVATLRPNVALLGLMWIKLLFFFVVLWITTQIITYFTLPYIYIYRRLVYPRQVLPQAQAASGTSLSRRAFISKTLALAPAAAFGLSTYSVYKGSILPKINNYELNYSDLPQNLSGIKIVQLSDLHIGPFFDIQALEQTTKLVLSTSPDLVVITGDLIDDLTLLDQTIQILSERFAHLPFGVYFCWGNHEYFHNLAKIRTAITNSPIKLLENSNLLAIPGETPLFLLGVDYPWGKTSLDNKQIRSHYMALAKTGLPRNSFNILLSHHPDFLENGLLEQIPLTLAGHTHGGQVAIMGKCLLPLSYKYMRGFYRQNSSIGYVNVGAGNWLPFRLGCDSEIAVFTLQKK